MTWLFLISMSIEQLYLEAYYPVLGLLHLHISCHINQSVVSMLSWLFQLVTINVVLSPCVVQSSMSNFHWLNPHKCPFIALMCRSSENLLKRSLQLHFFYPIYYAFQHVMHNVLIYHIFTFHKVLLQSTTWGSPYIPWPLSKNQLKQRAKGITSINKYYKSLGQGKLRVT